MILAARQAVDSSQVILRLAVSFLKRLQPPILMPGVMRFFWEVHLSRSLSGYEDQKENSFKIDLRNSDLLILPT
jgi:hypothetical protein